MEPNTSSSSAAGTSSAIPDQSLPSQVAESLLTQPPVLVPASGSGSPAAVGDGSSVSIQGHATSSHFLPSSSFFPDDGTLHMTAGNIFPQPQLEAPPATHFTTTLAGQPRQVPAVQPQPSSWTAPPGMPANASGGAFPEFAGGESALLEQQIAALAFFSPASASAPPPPPPPPSSDYELPPLPESLRIPSPAEASSYNIGGSMIPWHHGGSSSLDVAGASGSNLAPPSADYELPPLPASLRIPSPVEASSYNMSSTIAGSTMPWHLGGSSSMDVAGASGSNFSPAPASMLQAPLLPVKQEPVNDEDMAARRDPVLVSLIDDGDEDELYYQDAILHSFRDGNSSMDIDSSSLSMGGNNNQSSNPVPMTMPLSSSIIMPGGSSSHTIVGGVVFTDAEMQILMRDKNLQELVKTDPKKVQRIIANRMGFAKRKAMKEMQTRDLERQVETMKANCSTMSAQLRFLEKRSGELEAQHKEMSMMVEEKERQSKEKDAMRETLQAKIKTLEDMKLNNALQMNPQMIIDESGVSSGAHGLHQQQMSSQITDGSASHLNNDLQHEMSPQMAELQQLQAQYQQAHQQGQQPQDDDDTFLGGQQHPDI
ncbi:unnamed protein product [Urochloa humidicola]